MSAEEAGEITRAGDPAHDNTVSKLLRIADDYRRALEPRFKGIVDNWKRYFNNRVDVRLPGEDWRSFTRRPTAFQIVETLVAVNVDLVTSADPIVQTEGVGSEDDPSARAIEREIDQALRRNKFNIHFEHMQRAKRVQGIAVGKVTYRRHGMVTTVPRVDEKAMEAFEDAVREGERQSRTKAPTSDPEAFELWRTAVNNESHGNVTIPPIPVSESTQKALVEGPWIERPSIFHLAFDPTYETIQEMPFFFHKIPTSYEDVLKRSDDDPNSPMPYLRSQVEQAQTATQTEDYRNWNKELATITGLEEQGIYAETGATCEIMEVWTNDPTMPFVQILNRKTIINKHPGIHPYCHGMKPYFYMKNTPIENQFIGMSEFEPVVDLYEEKNRLADLLADAVTLSVLPILVRSSASGFNPTTAGALRPGAVLDVRRSDGIKMLDKMNPGILDAFRELGAYQDEIDNTHATWGNVRGAGANVGRVSATDSVNRMNQALVRQKIHAQRDETDMQDAVIMILGLLYQFGDPDKRVNVGGKLVVIPRERFLDAIYEDFKFRGATKSINKAERVQALTQFDQQFKDTMVVAERRALMKEILFTQDVRAIERIVSTATTAEMVAAESLAKQAAMQPPPPPGGGPGAPPPPQPGAPGPQGVNPAPTDLGQELPLAILEQLAQGAPFEDPNAAVAPGAPA